LIVDQGPEFDCVHFKDVWCEAMNILPRFGAVGKHGSIEKASWYTSLVA
jgi:hypothetical protein